MPVDGGIARPQPRRSREGWGWLLLAAVSQSYLTLLGTLTAFALVPLFFGLSGTIVQSGSMRPLIKIGDVVLTQALPPSAAVPLGRVIIFRAPVGSARAGTELHRLVAINADGSLVTAGDANADLDSSPLDRRDILGQGRLLVPWVGLPWLWARTGAHGLLALWFIVTILAVIVLVLGPGRQRAPSRSPDDPSGSGSSSQELDEAGVADATGEQQTSLVPRRAVSATLPAAGLLGVLLIALALVAPPLGTAAAAFTAVTGSVGSSWSAGTWATSLAFTTNPTGSTGGIAFPTQPVVSIRDGLGATFPGSSAAVTLVLTSPGGATLTCAANPLTAVSGVAAFGGCKIDRAGTYTLTATTTGLTAVVSSTFTIAVGPAIRLGFTIDPSTSAVNASFGTQPRVAIQDAGGNTVTSGSASVTLAIAPPTGGATLSCSSNPRSTSSGVASFSSCKINTAGSYTLTATTTSLAAAVSARFNIFGAATKLAFTTNPSAATGGSVFATQPVVTVQDAGANTVTTSAASISLTITTPNGATLSCTSNPKTALSGVAAFAGCKIDKAATYTLTATGTGLTSAVSGSLTITVGAAAKLAFTTNPSGATGGTVFATQPVVTVQDAGANTVTSSSAPISLTITTPNGATLSCTSNPKTALSGVAAFAGCKIDKAGSYTLTATGTGLTSAVSASLTIS
ncbi:MAG: S26 family signal peptidase [Actinobacteria bacterium]|nr:S26 family signal peptidase [Actinomycetota bacterium]